MRSLLIDPRRDANRLLAVACVVWTLPVAPVVAAEDEFAPHARIVYKVVEDASLRLHLFGPERDGSDDARPCIVFFFGGGWVSGTPEQFYPHCSHLARQGMVAISAEYRVEGKHGTTPFACVRDGKSAIRWVRTHAARLRIDPDRIAAGGGSAGGHVAAATATLPGFEERDANRAISARPDALVLFNPVFDNGPGGYGHERVRDRWREFSPLHNIDQHAPPTIVFFGTDDQLVPPSTPKEYQRRMESRGRRCDLHFYQEQPHGFFNYRDGKNEHYHDTVAKMDAFLESEGFLPAKAR